MGADVVGWCKISNSILEHTLVVTKKILNLIRALHRKALSRVNTAVGKALFAPIPKSCKLPVIFVKKKIHVM